MKLFLKQFGKTLQEIPLEEGREYFIGRHKDCDVVLGDEAGLSRKHVKIYQSSESGNWTVELISELGGLCLDGEELEGVELEKSAVLGLKNYVLEFLEEEENSIKSLKDKDEETQLPALEQSHSEPDLDGKTKMFSSAEYIYSLHIYIDGEISDHVSLNEESSWLIGRSEECDISIDYGVLTRKHLKITKEKGDFYIEDLGSSNKTFLNGKEILPHKQALLKANDQISISELKMVFEVRSRSFGEMMSNLPATSSQDLEEENLPEIPFPKVILEDVSEEEQEEVKSNKASFLKEKKRLIAIVGMLVLGAVLYSKYESDQKKKKLLAERQKQMEEKKKLEIFYQEALNSHEQKKFNICKAQLEELHRLAPDGVSDGASNSLQLSEACEQGLIWQKQKEEMLAGEEKERQTKEKIKKIVEKCQKEYQDKKITTEEQLDHCAEELLAGLDPANADISSIRMEIVEKEDLKRLQEQKRADYRRFIMGKRALYNKAKKKADQNKDLEAVAAYNVFLKSARGIAALQKLSDQAREERDSIQRNYDEELSRLHSSCEDLVRQEKMKEAYNDCKKVLLFKEDDKKAKEHMKTAKASLRKTFKPLYEQSMMDESFSRIEEAKKIWREILEKDIKGGHYYQKASAQIKKYK